MKVAQRQRAQFPLAFCAQDVLDPCLLFGRNEGHRRLMRQTDPARAVICRQPELDFRAGRGIAPVPSEKKTMRQFRHVAAL
ncbi:hypothetical protein GCM10027419_54170 [Pandoraea terrae]